MPNTFSQIYIQLVFAVKYRECLILPSWEVELYKYITGIIQNKGQKMLAINGMPDHIHIFYRHEPTCCISDLVREVKKSSDEFIKDNHFTRKKFQWQGGFGAFSYHNSQVPMIINYVMNQKQHHLTTKFRVEYLQLLKDFEIEYDEKYLFEFFD